MADAKTALERQIEQNSTKLQQLEAKLGPLLLKRDSELESLGQTTTDTANKVAGHATEFIEVKQRLDNLTTALEALETDPGPAEGKDANPDQIRSRMALGWAVAASPEFKRIQEQAHRNARCEMSYSAEHLWPRGRGLRAAATHPDLRQDITREEIARELRALSVELDDDSVGDAVHTFFAGIMETPKWMPVLRQLCGQRTTRQAKSVTDDRETDEDILAARISSTANTGQADVVVDEIEGFSAAAPFNAVRIKRAGGTVTTHTISSINTSTKTLTMDANLGTAAAAGDLVLAPGVTTTAEGALIPQTYDELTAATFPIAKLAIAKKVSIEKLADIIAFEQWIRRRLLGKVGRAEDLNGFYGAAGASSITGIYNDTDITEDTYSQASYGPLLDFFVHQFYELANLDYVATDTAVSVEVHRRLTKAKASDGHYLLWVDLGTTMGTAVHATRLHMARALQPTHAVMGAFPECMTFHDSLDATIEVGTEDKDLRKGKRTVVAMERLAIAINHPNGIRRMVIPA